MENPVATHGFPAQRASNAELRSLRWRHNGCDGVSNHQPHDCLLNRLFRRRSKKHQSSASLAFVRGIHRWPVNSPRKWPVKWKMFPFDNVIMDVFFFIVHIVELPVFRDTSKLLRRHCNQWPYWQAYVSLPAAEVVYCEWHRQSARLLRFQVLSVRAYYSSDLPQIQIVRSLLFITSLS